MAEKGKKVESLWSCPGCGISGMVYAQMREHLESAHGIAQKQKLFGERRLNTHIDGTGHATSVYNVLVKMGEAEVALTNSVLIKRPKNDPMRF